MLSSTLGLRSLFDPDSVAVVGASDDPAKWGHILSRRALESVGRRPVLLVNARGTVVLGRPTYRTLAEARRDHGSALDLVVVCVPAAALVGTVAEAVEAGARAVVVITAGFSELGAEGARLEQEAVAIARAAGAVLVGPNCLGVADTGTDLQLSHAALPVGEVAVLSQSGNMVLDLGALFVERGLGVSRFVSLGNQAQLGVVELMRSCVAHAGTRAVALYAEDVVDGRGFIAAARALREAGKPVVLLSPGRSAAAARSAVSHTGSLTSPAQVVDAACAVAGVRRVDNPTQMADLLQGLLVPRRLLGDRVAVLTDGGGHGAMAADALAAVGLDSPPLGEATRSRLREHLWASSTVANPVDLAGAGDRDPMNYARAVEALLEGDDVDAVLVTGYFGGYSVEGNGLSVTELAAVHSIALAVQAQHKPVVVHTIFPHSPSAAVLRAAGIPVHRDIDRACAVLAGLVEGPLPEVAQEQVPDSARVIEATYESARALFGAAGVRFPSAVTVTARSELEAAFETTGFPVVLKALGTQHKSDAGGVVLGLPDAAAALRGVRRPEGTPRPAGGLGRGDGGLRREPRCRSRGDRGVRARSDVRSGADGRARWDLRRGARRHRVRPGPGLPRAGARPAAVAAWCAAAAGRARSGRGGPRRAGGGGRRRRAYGGAASRAAGAGGQPAARHARGHTGARCPGSARPQRAVRSGPGAPASRSRVGAGGTRALGLRAPAR